MTDHEDLVLRNSTHDFTEGIQWEGDSPPSGGVLRVIAYLRVSTETQLEGYGLDNQRDLIDAWAAHADAEIVATYTDQLSGTVAFDQRPELALALDRITRDGVDGLVVPRLDRLARHLHEQEAALAHVWASGHSVWSADTGEVLRDDPDDPMRTALRQMMGVFAQLERGMIRSRLRAGRRAKREATGWAGGTVPYGWRSVDGALIADEVQQRVVELVHSLRAQGMTTVQIPLELNLRRIPGPAGGYWHRSAVRRVLADAYRSKDSTRSNGSASPDQGSGSDSSNTSSSDVGSGSGPSPSANHA